MMTRMKLCNNNNMDWQASVVARRVMREDIDRAGLRLGGHLPLRRSETRRGRTLPIQSWS